MMVRKFTLWAGLSVAATLICCAAGYIGAQELARRVRPAQSAAAVSQAVTQDGQLFVFEPFYKGRDQASKEYGNARSDHASLALAIARCYAGFGSPLSWSATQRAMLFFDLDDEHLMHSLRIAGGTGGDKREDLPSLNPFHAAAIAFSDRISRDRLEYRRELEDKRSLAWWYQCLILGLGAAATIFVTVRSMLEKANKWAFIVGLFAIALSASQAAVSSMSGFEASQATALRDQRALSQLQQLHWRITSDVLGKPELCKNNPEADPGQAMAIAGAWRTRLEAILDNAVESIARPGDISGGQAPSESPPAPAASPKAAVPTQLSSK